jgi:tetratricopeptide (TPR) repeat protein
LGAVWDETPSAGARYAQGSAAPIPPDWLERLEADSRAAARAEGAPQEVAVSPAPVAVIPAAQLAPAVPEPIVRQAGEIVEMPATEVAVASPVPVAEPAAGPAPAQETAAPVAAPVADPPQPAPPAPAPPVQETLEQRAERLLQDARGLASVGEQAQLAEADAEFEAGIKLLNDLEYAEAQRHFENAVRLNPAHQRAQEQLRKVRALMGVRADRLSEKLRALAQEERVRIQEQIAVLSMALEEARGYEQKGSEVDITVADAGKEQILADQLGSLLEAQTRYRRVREILNWMPPQIELGGERRAVEESLNRIQKKIADKEDEISFLRRQQAAKLAEEQRVRETELFRQRIAKLLEQVAALYYQGEYTAAEKLSLRVLQLDPLNPDAETWKRKARAAYHVEMKEATKEAYEEAKKQSWAAGEEAHIPYGDLLVYPPNWDQISRRAAKTAIGRPVGEEQWKIDIRKRLQRRVSFEFVDTPLQEAIAFLRSLTNVTMILDPRVVEAGPPAINLRVTDMSLELALGWILKLADLDYALKDKAIFISKPTSLQEDVELRIYDVSDLTLSIQDMPGPDLQVQTVDPTDASVSPGIVNPFVQQQAAPQVTAASIKDTIRLHVKPESWDPAQGTSIEERGGKLVVMQRPQVHALIDQLLANFRATQKIMVNVESRFLLLRESGLENIGVEWSGLDPFYSVRSGLDQYGRDIRGLAGDFGDFTSALGAAQPRVSGALNNMPYPGFTKSPNDLDLASFSTVGAIVTRFINFANDQDTISNTQVQNSGLAAQLTVLSDPQYQAFIRALSARENVSTLMTPRLTVYNTQRAHMFVARQKSYISDYEISGDAYDPVIRQFLSGVVLDVRPTVSSDRRYIHMELRPSLTEQEGDMERIYLQVPMFVNVGGATFGYIVILPIQFPNLSIRRIRTTVTCPDGGIIFIGGLYRNVRYNYENGVPFLSDLPVVGRLFRWNVNEKGRSNLAVLVSPKIILFSEEEAKL